MRHLLGVKICRLSAQEEEETREIRPWSEHISSDQRKANKQALKEGHNSGNICEKRDPAKDLSIVMTHFVDVDNKTLFLFEKV